MFTVQLMLPKSITPIEMPIVSFNDGVLVMFVEWLKVYTPVANAVLCCLSYISTYIHTYICANTTHSQYSSFPFLGNIAGTLVAFNATMYMANISRAAPVGTVILSVGLTMSRTAASETYSVSTPIGVMQPPEPYKIESSGQNKGRLSVKVISRNQAVDKPYKSVVMCHFSGTSAAISADLEVRVVMTLGEYLVSVARGTTVHMYIHCCCHELYIKWM